MAKILNIIESAYRGTLEEQDDTIVWITHALKGAGADIDVLLRGNAVNYAAKGQQGPVLRFGARQQKHGPDIAGEVKKLVEKGVKVRYVAEDAKERGLEGNLLLDGVEPVAASALPALLDGYERIWHW
jgi:predicted peroxiredoxin